MAIIIDGNRLAQEIIEAARSKVLSIKKKLRLASILVGENEAALSFLKQKETAAKEAGIDFRLYRFPEDIATSQLRKRLAEIVHLDQNSGVIVQLPLPQHRNTQYLLNAITPQKDVDCLSERSLGAFLTGRSKILPPSVAALKFLFEKYGIEPKGKTAVIVGAGRLIGRPVALWLIQQEANVIILNEYAQNIAEFTKKADILVSGAGKPNLITEDMVPNNGFVFDFGFSKENGKIVGDVAFEEVKNKVSLITPVPGGMGPLTVAFLIKNVLTLGTRKK